MKKVLLVVLILVGVCVLSSCSIGNRNIGVDLKQSFDEAIIALPNGKIVEGKITSWRDFEESDTIQITIGNVTYLTHYNNVILIRYDNQH